MLNRHNAIRIRKRLLPVLVLGLAVGFLLSFGCGDDGENGGPKTEASGAVYTGMYPIIASNFSSDGEGDCEFPPDPTCGEGPPVPGCEELDVMLVQNDDAIVLLVGAPDVGEGTIYNDGSFVVNLTFTVSDEDPITMEITVTGDISADKIEGSASIVVEGVNLSCHGSFDFSGPVTSNATVTVNFSGQDGKNVYAMVFVSGVTGDGPPPAMGGGELADGSVEIKLKPTLEDGVYELGVIVDTDGNIEESFEEGGEPMSDGDWVAGDIILTISGGNGSATLNKDDDFCAWPCP